jgi:hypothetical protein
MELNNKEDCVETGTSYEHPQARDYLTQQHRNSKNSSIIKRKNDCFKTLEQGFTHAESTDYSLW